MKRKEKMMSWQSPIEIMVADAEYRLEESVMKAIQKYGIKVDKYELLKALDYDREQYDKGYSDGYAKAKEELVRCKDCVSWDWCGKAYITDDKTFRLCDELNRYTSEAFYCGYGSD